MEQLEHIPPGEGSVTVFPEAAISVHVVGLGALALDTGAVHPDAAQLALRVTPAAQTRLEEGRKRGEE